MANIENLRKNLEKRGFLSQYFETGAEAAIYLNGAIDGVSVGIGGTMTVRDIGLYEMLESHNRVIWHWKGDSHQDALLTDVYITSVNAVAETGELINIDGAGNRVATSIYAHKKVYFVIGINKIEPDFERAMFRARNVAGPLRAQSMNRNTPCALKADKCYDCNSPERICNALTVLWGRTFTVDEMEVVIIGESFGM